jgi:proteasome beta subunit
MREMREGILKGTTTVGLVCEDGIVLASEKRATMGSFIASKSARKIYKIGDMVGLTTAGAVGDAQTLARLTSVESGLFKMRRQKSMTVKAIATLLANVLSGQRLFPYYVQLLVGGLDETGPNLFSLDAIGGQIDEKELVATGSGSQIAYGVLEEKYTSDMAVEMGVELVIRALHAAMKRDSASGDEIEVVKITPSGYETLEKEKVEELRSALT